MFTKQTIKDVNLSGRTVLLRADYNVPLSGGKITDDYRIQQSLPTLHYLVEHNAKVVICSHLGRPEGGPNPDFSLFPVAKRLTSLLPGVAVSFVDDTVGEKARTAVKKLKSGEIVLLENLRFNAEEEKNDDDFARQLASFADVFIQDGFGVVHRAHASTDAVTKYLPSVAGLLLEKEVDTLTAVMEAPERPLMAVVGGAKIADKIEILTRFIEVADFMAIGGAMANTFLLAQGHDVAKSLVDRDELPLAKRILEKARVKAKDNRFMLYLPQDVVVSKKIDSHTTTRIVDWRTHVASSIEYYPKHPPQSANTIYKDEMIVDIGPFSASFIAGAMQLSDTVIWNGTMGVTEVAALRDAVGPFAHGTELVVDAMLGGFGHKPFTVVGGGDTVGYIQNQGLMGAFGHVSTGGGASLELLAGRTLPGIAALQDKKGVQ
jgi:phosphoglycerate kinase